MEGRRTACSVTCFWNPLGLSRVLHSTGLGLQGTHFSRKGHPRLFLRSLPLRGPEGSVPEWGRGASRGDGRTWRLQGGGVGGRKRLPPALPQFTTGLAQNFLHTAALGTPAPTPTPVQQCGTRVGPTSGPHSECCRVGPAPRSHAWEITMELEKGRLPARRRLRRCGAGLASPRGERPAFRPRRPGAGKRGRRA